MCRILVKTAKIRTIAGDFEAESSWKLVGSSRFRFASFRDTKLPKCAFERWDSKFFKKFIFVAGRKFYWQHFLSKIVVNKRNWRFLSFFLRTGSALTGVANPPRDWPRGELCTRLEVRWRLQSAGNTFALRFSPLSCPKVDIKISVGNMQDFS